MSKRHAYPYVGMKSKPNERNKYNTRIFLWAGLAWSQVGFFFLEKKNLMSQFFTHSSHCTFLI